MFEATVRYGYMMLIGSFTSDVPVRSGDKVIVRTDRGTELGEVITISEQVASSEDTENQVVDDITPKSEQEDSGESLPAPEKHEQVPRKPSYGPRVLRKASKEDIAKAQDINESVEPAQFRFCQQKIRELNVPMRLAAVEHLFGGEKLIFYFLAESRVDFRALVRELAREYRTRIEMKQIGARDEAKLLSDYEHCGREVCCRKFIRALEPVTIRMAKNQKATLDPAKISGACGRLMCCLRFENPVYKELKRQLPRKGKKVKTPKGRGEVLNYDIIAQTVLVEESSGERVTYKLKELSWQHGEDEHSGDDDRDEHESENNEEKQHNDKPPRKGDGSA
jgi:cell fate regulator YaaT (PSP1 superfamily)